MIKNRFLFLMMLTAMPLSVQAWENCGQIDGEDSNCEYQVSSDGVLTIRPIDSSQEAVMPTYSYSYNPTTDVDFETTAPWYDERHNITSLQIEDGIQNISSNAFMEMRWLKSVDMADSVVSIGADAFTNAASLTDVNLSKNLKTINSCAFQDADNLGKINLPDGITRVDYAIFNGVDNITSLSIPDSLIDSAYFNGATLNNSNIQTLYCSKE
ncbi:MAG: leucine-rich repeat domain-containing protein, partial [Alphaproteobacteria bacterium]|nr:leucine-rich repeat domain-containing protein [Alphaproteobacteria bacterium]